MHITIGVKIFGIAAGLLVLMGAAAGLSMRMTRTVDAQLVVLDKYYFPAYVRLAQANIHSVQESAYIRRLLLALDEGTPPDSTKIEDLRQRTRTSAEASDKELAEARERLNELIPDPIDFDDTVALARLDTHIEFLQEERRRYEAILAQLLEVAATGQRSDENRILAELDSWRDDFDRRIEAARIEMRRLAGAAILGTRSFQERVVEISLALLALAGLLGLIVAAAVTTGLVRPVRRLLAGTAAVEQGALDTVVPVTSRDEIGRLTASFNNMVTELRVKAQIRETFGKYVDPRIVAGLIDRPELADPGGSRREMTILFCDMQNFTGFSEEMTPAALVTVMNRYLTVMSEPVREHNGIIDKYLGDGIMAFWGPPFTAADEHARLACLAGLDQLACLEAFDAELPHLTGVRRGLAKVQVRIGIATGEVVVGNIGSEQTRSYTVIGDTVNLASRLDGACKSYGARALISEATQREVGDAVELREIDTVLVRGKTEPEHVFELLGRKGNLSEQQRELRATYGTALAAYRRRAWDEAVGGFEACLAIDPEDPPSRVMLARVLQFRERPPADDWDGVWVLEEK